MVIAFVASEHDNQNHTVAMGPAKCTVLFLSAGTIVCKCSTVYESI
jgi:hypothetical protein